MALVGGRLGPAPDVGTLAVVSNQPHTRTERVPNLTRAVGTGGEAVFAWTRQAASSVRRHRDEMLILAATLAFVLVVALVSLPALM